MKSRWWMIFVILIWMLLLLMLDKHEYPRSDSEMWVESLKWGLP